MTQTTRTSGVHSLDDYLGTCNAADFGDRVVERLKRWRETLETNGLLSVWQRNRRQYMNASAEPTAGGWQTNDPFSIQGENGEILAVRINEARNLVTNMLNLTFAKPIGLKPVATNATPEALEGAEIAETRLTEMFHAGQGDKVMRDAGEIALVVTTGFVDVEWDLFAGEAFLPADDQTQTYTGAPKLSTRWPDEVCFDITKKSWSEVWDVIVIQRANRFILASQYPDWETEILAQPSFSDSEFCTSPYADEDSDDIAVLKYVHRPVNPKFLPNGRYGLVLEDGTAIRDGDSPYAMVGDGKLGIFPITAASGMGSVYGYPVMNDLSPLQQWLNLVATMIATLVAGYGAPNVSGPALLQMDIQQMVGGGRYFGMKAGQGDVKALNLLPDLKPLFELIQAISSFGEKLSGMNSVVRGGAERDMSGKAVALWKSMAVQFMSSFMQSAIEQKEAVGDYILRLEETFATGEQIAARTGDDNVQQVVKYRAADKFRYVAKVRAEAVDPVAMTPEGREARADKLLEANMFPPGSTAEYMTMVKTGRDEPMFKAPMAHLMLIQRENSLLLRGEEPIVLEDDKHELHIDEHAALLAEPSARGNEQLMAVVLEHKAKHVLFTMGVSPMQGVDPQTGMPYPSAVEQLEQAKAQAAMVAQQQAMMQGPQGPPQNGDEQQGPPQSGGGGAPPQGEAPMTVQDSIQQSIMTVPGAS